MGTTDVSAATPEAVFNTIARRKPLGSISTPECLVNAVLFFA
jgi:hypothetical protein